MGELGQLLQKITFDLAVFFYRGWGRTYLFAANSSRTYTKSCNLGILPNLLLVLTTLSRSSITTKTADPLLSKDGIENLRTQRVWRMVWVQLVTWLFFAIFIFVRAMPTPALICLAEAGVMFGITRLQPSCRESGCGCALNASLTLSGIGLILVSLCDPSLARTMFFFPVSILFSFQLLGVRAAFGWMLISFLGQTVYYWQAYGAAELWLHRIDELTLSCGVSACWFLCCQQGEAFYRERTKALKDISARLKLKSINLEKLATTDSLTGLMNRHQFQIRLDHAVADAKLREEQMALIVIDLNGFKQINDTLGHLVGDEALVMVSDRLRKGFPDAQIARMGGDEFCVIFSNVASIETGESLAKQACQVLDGRYLIDDDLDLALNASVGLALCPMHSENATNLFAFADTAMFVAKATQTGFAVYESQMTETLVGEREMLDKLSVAMQRQEFFLEYQPQICLRTNAVTGVEALLRWRCDGELISPARFIPLLEKNRQIVNVGQWVIWESCRQLRQWQDAGIDLNVSINISAIQFNDAGFNETIEQPIGEFELSAKHLDFEITESLLITDVQQAVDRLNRIKELGASISIDDFGTGYSSLAYLRQFPIDRLKIDRAFVKDIPDRDDGVIATSIVALGKAIGLKVLAEGVETSAQLDFLKNYDCDEYQGYLFSRPVAASVIEDLVKANQSTAASQRPLCTARIAFDELHTHPKL